MGDMGDYFNDVKDHYRDKRARLGIECPECKRLLPKASATILLPGQRCVKRGHRYQDMRVRGKE